MQKSKVSPNGNPRHEPAYHATDQKSSETKLWKCDTGLPAGLKRNQLRSVMRNSQFRLARQEASGAGSNQTPGFVVLQVQVFQRKRGKTCECKSRSTCWVMRAFTYVSQYKRNLTILERKGTCEKNVILQVRKTAGSVNSLECTVKPAKLGDLLQQVSLYVKQ